MEQYNVVSRAGIIVSRVENALGEKGVELPCPRCGNREFSILDGVVLLRPREVVYGVAYYPSEGDPIPLVVVFCKRCGYKFEHLAEILEVDLDSSEVNDE